MIQLWVFVVVQLFCVWQPSLWYHSSSVLALALDGLTAPYRLRNNSVPMWQVADSLAVSGRKVPHRTAVRLLEGSEPVVTVV